MTNFEKYKDEILKLAKETSRIAIANRKPISCYNTKCNKCLFYVDDIGYCKNFEGFVEWLYEEYKEPAPQLTLAERYFCETFLEDDRLYLARDQYDNLYLYDVIKPPIKNVDSGYWALQDSEDTMLEIKKDFFSFIKWEDEKLWSISDLLKLEVEK